MDKIEIIKKHLSNEKQSLLKTLKSAKETRDSAPSAMESHHDTTKNQAEKFVVALEKKLHNLEKSISNLPNPQNIRPANKIALWSYMEANLNGNKMKLIIVPEGIGGKQINNIHLISDKTPLGSAISNKRKGEEFEFNNQQGTILLVK